MLKEKSREGRRFRSKRALIPLACFACAAAVVLLSLTVRGNSETLFHFRKEKISSILLHTSEDGWIAHEAESISQCVDLLNSFQYRSTKTVNPGRDDNGSHYQLTIFDRNIYPQNYYIGSNWSAVLVGRTWYYGEEGCLKPLKEILERAAEDEASSLLDPIPADPLTSSEASPLDEPFSVSAPADSGKLCHFEKDDVTYIVFSGNGKSLTWQDAESVSLCVDLLNSFQYSDFQEQDSQAIGEQPPFSLSLYCPSGRGHECYRYGIGADWGSVHVTEYGLAQVTYTYYFGEENYFEPIRQLAGLG